MYISKYLDTPQVNTSPVEADTPLLTEMATGAKRGLFTAVPEMVGGAMKAFTPVGSRPYIAGQDLQDSAKSIAALPELQKSNTKRGIAGDILVAGAEGVGQMVPVLAGSIVNPLLGAGIAGAMYGGSTYQDTKERMLKQEGLDDAFAAANPNDERVQKAKSTGLGTGLAQGVGDAAMSYPGGRFLKGAFPALGKQTAEGVVKGIAQPGISTLKNFSKAWGAEVVGEGITEAVQDETQAAIERSAGLKDAPVFMAQAADSAKGGIGTALLLGPLAGPGHYKAFRDAAHVQQALADPATEPALRAMAAQIMGNEIAKVDKTAAVNFLGHAYDAIGDEATTGSKPYALDLNSAALLQPFTGVTTDNQSNITAVPPGGDTAAGEVVPDASPAAPAAPEPLAPGGDIAGTSIVTDSNPPPKPAGAMVNALAAGGISMPVTGDMYSSFAAAPFANAPDAGQPVPAAGKRVAGLLESVQPETELETAKAWAIQQIQAGGNGHLMQGNRMNDTSYGNYLVSEYRKAQEKTNGTANILPDMQDQGPGQVDGARLAVPALQGTPVGNGSNNTSSGGITDGMSSVQQKTVETQEVSPVRSQAVVDRVAALKQEKTQLLSDNRGKGIAGGLIHSPEVTQRLGEINAEIHQQTQAEEYRKIATATPGGFPTPLDAQAHNAATSPANDTPHPTQAQIEAGNYKKGHVNVRGLDISIENPAGSIRKGTDENGKAWETKLAHHYGYIKGTIGKDKDHIDVFIGTQPDSDKVYVVDQIDPATGKLDEHKVMLGFDSVKAARTGYLANYDKSGSKRIGSITESSVADFKQWLKNGNTKKKFAGKPSITAKPANSRRQLDSSTDSLPVAVAKLGGISRAEIDKQTGTGKDLTHALNKLAMREAKAGWMYVIRPDGMPLDQMREALVEQGYLNQDSDINDLLDKLDSASRGTVHRSSHFVDAGADAYREAEIRYSEMINAMTDGEYEEFSRNQWLDEQVQELADASDILDEYLDSLDNETMTAADWQAIENDFREALNETEVNAKPDGEVKRQEQPPAAGKTGGVPANVRSDASVEGAAETGEVTAESPFTPNLPEQAVLDQTTGGSKHASMILDFMNRLPVIRENNPDKAIYQFNNNHDQSKTVQAADKFWEMFGIYDKQNPLAGKFGHAIYFQPDKRSVTRLGIDNAFIEYVLHSVTSTIGNNYNERTTDNSKINNIDNIMSVITDADGYYEENGKLYYYKEVREGKKPNAAIVLELDKDGKVDDYRYVTQLPNQKKRALAVNPVAASLDQKQTDGTASPDRNSIVPPPKENVKQESKTKVTDAGEELLYNKRNRVKSGLKWADIKDKNDTLKAKEIQKGNIYPKPDYAAMVEGGIEPIVAHIIKQVYDSISIKPDVRGIPSDADFQLYITAVNRVMEGALQWANDKNAVAAWAGKQAKVAGAALGKQISLTDMGGVSSLFETVYPGGWKNFSSEVNILDGRKLFKALQPGYDQINRAIKDVGQGWPAQVESWQKQGYKIIPAAGFSIKESNWRDGTTTFSVLKQNLTSVSGTFDSREKAQAFMDVLKPFVLFNKRGRMVDSFVTEEQAKEAARAAVKKEGGVTVEERGVNVADAERTGPEFRTEGENVTAEQLMETIGFKGVNFGNWVPNDERQLHLNHAYDSFLDLAAVLNLPPRALSLNGMLGLAIGAQGSGSYAAHFVPGVNEINITRTMGAGSVAHEWAHAVDHYFATQAGFAASPSPWMTVIGRMGNNSEVRQEIVTAFADIVRTMKEREATPEELAERAKLLEDSSRKKLESWLKYFEKEFAGNETASSELAVLMGRIRKGDYQSGEDAYVTIVSGRGRNLGTAVLSIVADIRDLAKKYKIRIPTDNIKALDSNVSFVKYLEEKKSDDHKPQIAMTRYQAAANKLDHDKKGKAYWSTPLEMFARAFDAYVTDKLAARTQNNDYLSHTGRGGDTVPMGEERTAINAAFDVLIGGLKTKETDKGVALFKLSSSPSTGIQATEAQAWVATLPIAAHVNVVQSVDNLPAAARSQITLAGVNPAWVHAMELDGTIHVIADNVPDLRRVKALVIGHELAHAGQTKKVVDLAVDWFKRTKDGKTEQAREAHIQLERIADLYGYDLADEKQFRRAVQETTAAIAEQVADGTLKPVGLMQRLFMYIKHWMRQNGLISHVSDSELSMAVAEMLRIGEKRLSVGKGGSEAQFAVRTSEDVKANFALLDQAISQHAASINAPAKVADMVKSLIELAGQSLPPRLKANIGKIMSNPWFGSEGKPIRRHVVNLNLERSQNRNGIISDLFQESEGYAGVEGLDNILKGATKEEIKLFNDLIKYGDRNDIGQTFTRDELYRGKTPFGKVPDRVVKAYKAFQQVMQAANRVRFQQLDELSLLPYKDQDWYSDLIELLNRNGERAAGLNQVEAGEFHRLIRSLKRGLTDEELASGENPAKVKASPAVIAAYHDFWRQVDQTDKKHQGNMLSAFRDILGYRGEIDKLKNEWGNLKGYAPRNRKDGDWHVSVYTINSEGERVKVYMKPTLTETGAKGLVKEVQSGLEKHLKSNFDANATYEVEYERNEATPSELLAWKGSEVAVEALLNQAFDRAGVTGKMSVEQWQSLKHEVFQQIAKEIMAQGFGRHGISREATLIEGYDDTDYQTVLKEYISGMAGWLSKMRFAIETTGAAKDISKADPTDKVWVNDYVQDAMKNSTYMDELAATARSVGAVYYLGFKVSSAMLNAFQNYTVGQAELTRIMKKAGLSGSSVKLLLTAQKDVMKDFVDRKKGGKGTLSQEEHDVLFRAVREGTAQAQNVRMISGSQEMGFGTGWKKFTELSMTPFQFVEQRLNREPAVLAAYRAFKKTAPGEFDAAAYKQAEEFVNNTHYVMGKENLPEIVRKLGPLGKTAYLFQGYVHNYLHWMFNRAKNGEFEAIARSLGAVAALGGVFALPGADDLDKWIMKWFGVSYKMKFKKFVRDNTGNSPAGQMIQNFVNHGVTSVAGVDMSRALAINIPFVSDPDRTFGERMGGAWGGLLKKPGMALSAAQKGDYLRAVENMMPEFAANPMRALRQYDQGATTLSGKPIFDETGHQVKYDGIDVAKKMLGFNPLEISDRTALKGNERDLNAYWKSERDDVLANLRRAKTSEDMKAAVRGVIKYNTELRKSQAFGLVPIIKAESIQKVRTFKPQKKTLSWERNQLDSGNN